MPNWSRLVQVALGEAKALVDQLPEEVRSRAESVPIFCRRRPDQDLIDSGIEPDILGLFEGPSLRDGDAGEPAFPPRITLFLSNLWEEAEGDDNRFREEVRTTILHELGHFLGHEEEDLAERDLE